MRDHVVSTSTYRTRADAPFAMSLTPESTMSQCNHQYVLLNSTNVLPQTYGHPLPIPPEDVPSKRRPPTPDEAPAKRPRLTRPNEEADDDDTEGSDLVKRHTHRHTMFSMLQTLSRRPLSSSPRIICTHLHLSLTVHC